MNNLSGRTGLRVVSVISAIGALAACAAMPQPEPPTDVIQVGPSFREAILDFSAELDAVGAYLDEWGSISISAPLVVTSGEDFRFELRKTDEELFLGNKQLDGRSTFDLERELKARLELDAARDAAQGDQATDADKQPASTTPPSDPPTKKDTPPTTSPPPTANPPAAPPAGSSDAIGGAQRRLIRKTASDRFELGLHKALSGAREGKIAEGDYRLVYLVFTVSFQPGWRTAADHIGQLDVLITPADDAPATPAQPGVVAVYPAFEGQELDLRSSAEEMFAFAFQLAAKGQVVGARLFLEYAERLERETQTRTALSLINSYTNGGRNFGYEMRPTFRSQTDPSVKKPRAGYELDAVTFPAVAIVAIPDSGRADGRTSLNLRVSHRWRPTTAVQRQHATGREFRRASSLDYSESRFAEVILRLYDVARTIDTLKSSDDYDYDLAQTFTERWTSLQARLGNNDMYVPITLPARSTAPPLTVAGVHPAAVKPGVENVFFLEGTGFKSGGVIRGVEVFEGSSSKGPAQSIAVLSDTVLKVTTGASLTPQTGAAMSFRVTGADGTLAHSPAFTMLVPPAPPPAAVEVSVHRTEQGAETTIKLPPGLMANGAERTELLKAVQEILKKDPPRPPEPEKKDNPKQP